MREATSRVAASFQPLNKPLRAAERTRFRKDAPETQGQRRCEDQAEEEHDNRDYRLTRPHLPAQETTHGARYARLVEASGQVQRVDSPRRRQEAEYGKDLFLPGRRR